MLDSDIRVILNRVSEARLKGLVNGEDIIRHLYEEEHFCFSLPFDLEYGLFSKSCIPSDYIKNWNGKYQLDCPMCEHKDSQHGCCIQDEFNTTLEEQDNHSIELYESLRDYLKDLVCGYNTENFCFFIEDRKIASFLTNDLKVALDRPFTDRSWLDFAKSSSVQNATDKLIDFLIESSEGMIIRSLRPDLDSEETRHASTILSHVTSCGWCDGDEIADYIENQLTNNNQQRRRK